MNYILAYCYGESAPTIVVGRSNKIFNIIISNFLVVDDIEVYSLEELCQNIRFFRYAFDNDIHFTVSNISGRKLCSIG